MEFFCGLDVGMDETAICVVDDKGKVVLELAVVTHPNAIKATVKPYLGRLDVSATRPAPCRPGCIRSCSNAACRRCVWRPSICAPRCRRSATRPTKPMRLVWCI